MISMAVIASAMDKTHAKNARKFPFPVQKTGLEQTAEIIDEPACNGFFNSLKNGGKGYNPLQEICGGHNPLDFSVCGYSSSEETGSNLADDILTPADPLKKIEQLLGLTSTKDRKTKEQQNMARRQEEIDSLTEAYHEQRCDEECAGIPDLPADADNDMIQAAQDGIHEKCMHPGGCKRPGVEVMQFVGTDGEDCGTYRYCAGAPGVLSHGLHIFNDIWKLRHDPRMTLTYGDRHQRRWQTDSQEVLGTFWKVGMLISILIKE